MTNNQKIRVSLSLTQENKSILEQEAKNLGITLSTYLSVMVGQQVETKKSLMKMVDTSMNQEILKQLSK